jgi:hypothetical protein
MSTKRAAVAAFILLNLVSASTAIAVDKGVRGFYLGVSGGQSSSDTDVDFDIISRNAGFTVRNSDLDDKDDGYSIFGGYRFFRYLAVEAEYIHLGEVRYTAQGTLPGQGPTPFLLTLGYKTRGVTGSVLGTVPLSDNFELFGRAGFLFANTDITGTLTGSGVNVYDTQSGDELYSQFGIGAALNFQRRWTARFEFRAYRDVGDDDEGLDYTSLSIIYRL